MVRMAISIVLVLNLTASATLISRWQGEDKALDSVGANQGTASPAIRTVQCIGQAFQFPDDGSINVPNPAEGFYNHAPSAAEMQAVVPEPTAIGAIAASALGALGRRRRQRARACLARAAFCEPIESRLLLSTISWTNRNTFSGTNDNRFDEVFGTLQNQAIGVVDAAIAFWQRTIQNFNYDNGTNTYNISVSMNASAQGTGNGGVGANANVTGNIGSKPSTATMGIGWRSGVTPGTNSAAGWYLDPTPLDASEFTVTSAAAPQTNAFSNRPNITLGGVDLFSTVLHELGHAMGLSSNSVINAFATNTQVNDTINTPASSPVSQYWRFDSPRVHALFTAWDSGGAGGGGPSNFQGAQHFAPEGATVFQNNRNYYGAGGMMNASGNGTRRIIDDTSAMMLEDAYAYTVRLPSNFWTFYNRLDADGTLTITPPAGNNNDSLEMQVVGSDLIMSMSIGAPVNGIDPATIASTIPLASITRININMGGGSDQVSLSPISSSIPISLQMGNDSSFDTLTINGSAGFDALVVNASTGQLSSTGINITSWNGPETFTYNTFDGGLDASLPRTGTILNVTINGSIGGEVINLFTLDSATPCTINANGGNDKVVIGEGSLPNLIQSPVTVNAGSGDDLIVLASGPHQLSKITQPITVRGDANNDTLAIGTTNVDGMDANVTFDGGNDLDTLTFFDTGANFITSYDVGVSAVNRTGWFTHAFNYSNTEQMNINCGSSPDSVIVRNNVAPTVSAFGNEGDDVFTFGDGLIAPLSGVVFNGGSGTDTITFDDHLQPGARTWDIITDRVIYAGAFVFLTAGFEGVNILAGLGGDTITFGSSIVGQSYMVDAGGGNDAVNDNSAPIASLTVRGGSGFNWLTVDDRNLTGSSIDQPNIYADRISRGFGPQLNVYYDDFASVVHYLPSTQNSVDVFGIPGDISPSASFQIRGNSSIDDFNIFPRDAQGLTINGILDLWGGGGQNTAAVWDAGTEGNAFSITSPNSGLTVLNGVGAKYLQTEADIQQFSVHGASGPDTFNVSELRTGMGVAIFGGSGDDACTIGNGDMAANLTSASAFSFDGQAGSDRFTINNGVTNTAWTYSATTGVLLTSRSSPTSYVWQSNLQNIESQYVFAGSAADTFNIDSTANGVYSEFNGFAGVDLFRAGFTNLRVNDIHGPITYNAGTDGGNLIVSNAGGFPATVHQTGSTVGAYAADNLFGSGGSLTFSGVTNSGGLAGVTIGLASNSTIYAQPLSNAQVYVFNGLLSQAPSGSIKLATAGVQNPVINGDSASGNLTSSNRQTLFWDRYSGAIQTDAIAPVPTKIKFKVGGGGGRQIAGQSVDVQFSEDVSGLLSPSFLSLQNLTTGSIVPASNIAVAWNAATLTATFTFPGYLGGVLPNGSYQAQLLAGLADQFGNPTAASNLYKFIWAAGTVGNDSFRIARAPNFSDVQVFINNDTTPAFVGGPDVAQIALAGDSGNDALVVDCTNLNPTPTTDGITFDGGDGADSIKAKGSPNADGFTFIAGFVMPGSTTITHPNVETQLYDGGGGFDSLGVYGTTVILPVSQRFSTIDLNQSGKLVVQPGLDGVLVTRALAIAAGSTLDLDNSDLVFDYTGASPLSTVSNWIRTARNGGAWNGATGITSTAARNASPANRTLGVMKASDFRSIYGANATFSGESIDTSAVLVKFTYYGDADFNGAVNFDDYSRTDAGFNGNRSGWLNGDFDLNGVVNFDDYSLIDLAFNTQ